MRREDVEKLRDELLDLSEEEWEALEHVQERIKVDGHHNVNGCPYPFRAMCPYRFTLAAIEARGLYVPVT